MNIPNPYTAEDFMKWATDPNNELLSGWVDPDHGMIYSDPITYTEYRINGRNSNGILTTAELIMLFMLTMYVTDVRMYAKHWTRLCSKHIQFLRSRGHKKLWFSQTPWDENDPSSHDNDTAIRSMSYYFSRRLKEAGFKEDASLLDWHKRGAILGRFWHPRDIIYYSWLKGGWQRWVTYLTLTWPLMILFQFISCYTSYKKRGASTIVKTDGKKLSWLRCVCTLHDSWVMSLSFTLCEWALKRNNKVQDFQRGGYADISTWRKSFAYFYNHPTSHPINYLMAQLYTKG